MFTAGQVSAVLEGKFNPAGFVAFGGAMNKAKVDMLAMEKGMAGASARGSKGMGLMGVAAKGMAGAVAGLGIVVGLSVKKAAEFEQQLSSLKSVSGATAGEMAKLKKSAMDAGAATKFSALDAAKAQTELAKGGLSTAKILGGGLKAALSLAAAGEMELADAASTTANALNLFGINASEAEHVADALATAANNTTADVGHFAMALTQGGAAAKSAGLNFDETVVALEALAANSVKGSDAGTSLKAAMTQIANPTDEAAQKAKQLGINFFDAQGSMRPLPDIARNLDQAFGGLNDKQRLAAASTIAGTDGMRVLLALYDSSPEKLRAYATGLEAQGTAARVAAEKQDNLQGKLENLRGSIETAMIALGEPLLEPLTEGAIDATQAINEMAASGDLTSFGQALGDSLRVGAEGFRVFVDVLQFAVEAAKAGLDGFLGTISTVLDALVTAGKVANKLNPFGDVVDTSELERASDRINQFRENLRGKPAELKVTADVKKAQAALERLDGTELAAKVMRVLARDQDAKAKLRALIALGIPKKDAVVLANVGDALTGINSVRGALAALPAFKQVTVRVNQIATGKIKAPNLTPLPRGRAAGHKTDGPELAIIGEGGGPEYVIPTERKHRGRAIGLLMDAAEELGVAAFAAGTKKGKKKPPKKRFIPSPAQVFRASPEDLDKVADNATERLRDAQQDAQEKGKNKKPTKKALEARKRIPELRAEARRRRAIARKARTYKEQIEREDSRIERFRDEMILADRANDDKRFAAAKTARLGAVKRKLSLLRAAFGAAPKGKPGEPWPAWTESLAKALGETQILQGDVAQEVTEEQQAAQTEAERAAEQAADQAQAEREAIADRLFDTGMTDEERKRLQDIEAGIALSALTTGLEDDKAAAAGLVGFLEGILGSVQADPARGGSGSIADIAGRLKQARDNLGSFSGGGAGGTQNENADLQAQINQANERVRVAERDRDVSAAALAGFGSLRDIGMASPNITINTLHPGDPNVYRAIGDAATTGQSMQGFARDPRERSGL